MRKQHAALCSFLSPGPVRYNHPPPSLKRVLALLTPHFTPRTPAQNAAAFIISSQVAAAAVITNAPGEINMAFITLLYSLPKYTEWSKIMNLP